MENTIRKYYDLVDKGDYSKFHEIFSKDIVYQRCERRISGIDNLLEFYYKERKIIGKHKILEEIQDKSNIVIQGVFNGKNGKGERLQIFFADFFKINDNNLIYSRKTYLLSNFKMTV